jgi:hypothetical protein
VQNKEIYFERTIQALEQQMRALQQGMNGEPEDHEDDSSSDSDSDNSGQDEDSSEVTVAEYIRRCRYG